MDTVFPRIRLSLPPASAGAREELLKVRKERKNEELCHHKVCPRCARDFYDPTNTMFFCPKCTAKAQNQPKIKPLEEDKQ